MLRVSTFIFRIMRKLSLLILFLIAVNSIARAQGCSNDFLGTKTLYQQSAQAYTSAPAGYMPVFINHVGRHGARHLTKTVESTLAYQLLFKADSAGQLSADGFKLKQMVLALQKAENGNTKSISAEGKMELEGIGERMAKNYGNVFASGAALNVRITKEARTKQSADAFVQGLNKRLPQPVMADPHNDDINLRFYDLSPAYKKFENDIDDSDTKTSFDRQLHLETINNDVASKFFKPEFLNKLDDKQKGKFVSDLFGFTTIVYSLQNEVSKAGLTMQDVDFKSFFTCEQLAALAMLDSADEYLKKGPGVDNEGIQVRVAIPLLVDFIKSADDFIKTGKYSAELRFAHAETIAPFAALLQIEGADKPSTNIKQIDKVWQASKIIPLSSNIQWIFYKKKGSGDYLVKILLNEKEARISALSTVKNSSYYQWKMLRSFYLKKLSMLHVSLTDDMNTYLADLK